LADHRQFQVSLGLLIMIVLEVGSEVEGHLFKRPVKFASGSVLGDR
jgi:hypothetical protein